MSIPVSLVIPVYNESKTIGDLINTINEQTYPPAEIILVDGGSEDDTVAIARHMVEKDGRYRIIEAGRAMPGKGRNIGTAAAQNEWIAYTDAGIKLHREWLSRLVERIGQDNHVDIVYGNCKPETNSFFEKCAAISYVSPHIEGRIRNKFIASSLLRKVVWEKTGGFPDLRAAEDLIFMENAGKMGFKDASTPEAIAYWKLRPGLISTYKRFDLYSKYNVWAGRQKYWHYGVAKQYLLAAVFILLGCFHHWLWLLAIPAWLLARAAKRIYSHRFEFGVKTVFNPAVLFMVIVITLTIDAATFSGWLKALFARPKS